MSHSSLTIYSISIIQKFLARLHQYSRAVYFIFMSHNVAHKIIIYVLRPRNIKHVLIMHLNTHEQQIYKVKLNHWCSDFTRENM